MAKSKFYNLDTDSTLGGNNASDIYIASQKAVKSYVDNRFFDRCIGQIIQSTIPLADAGLHLLDGALISGSGSYSAFVDYIAGLVSSYPDIFETEANWQTAVTTYGVCGKFVYDSVNNTVRLPKITGIIEGTTDLTALGDLIQQYVKLPNITGTFFSDGVTSNNVSGAFGYVDAGKWGAASNESGYWREGYISIDASRSSSVYSGNGTDTKIQPQAIKVLYYIVIATTTKTEIEVDIDEIATDLNGKADVDLSNINASASAKNTINSWGMPDYSAGVQKSYPFTAEYDGIANVYGASSGADTVIINGSNQSGLVFSGTNGVTCLLNKGDILNVTGSQAAYIYFFPLKGAS